MSERKGPSGPSPLAPVARPYDYRVSVQRSPGGLYAWLVSLNGWHPSTDLRAVALRMHLTGDVSPAGAQVAAATESIFWIDVEND